MKRSEGYFAVLRLLLDGAAVACALLGSFAFRNLRIDLIPGVQLLDPALTLPPLPEYVRSFVIPGVLLFLCIAAFLRLYSLSLTESAWREVGRVLLAAGLWLALVVFWYFFVRKELFYSRLLLIHSTLLTVTFVLASRALLTLMQRALLHRGIGRTLVLSVGQQQLAKAALAVLIEDRRYKYLGHVQNFDELRTVFSRTHPDLVLQTDAHPRSGSTQMLIDFCRSRHIGYAFLPPVFADVPQTLVVERLGLLPYLRFQPTPIDGWGRVGKRVFDLVLSALFLVLLLPFLALMGLLILLCDGMPIFYVSRRTGEHAKRTVPVLKFRTMVPDADKRKSILRAHNHRRDGPLFKMKQDPRITRLGRVLRRWSVDELPQLLNVLLGQMSLVGPRPHLPEEVSQYNSYQRRVFAVKPGITGLAQISGRSNLTFAEEVRFDLQYVEEWSMRLDLWILWRTFVVVFSRDGAD